MKKAFLLIIYAVIIVSVAFATVAGVSKGAGRGQVGNNEMYGWGFFKAFTVDSNVLMAVVGIILSVAVSTGYRARWLTILNLASTLGVLVTFVTVVIFLSPMQIIAGNGCLFLYVGDMLFLHVLNPILAVVQLVIVEKGTGFDLGDKIWGVSPVLVYSVIYAVNVVFLRSWTDFYGFTFGGKIYMAPVSIIGMYAMAFGLVSLLGALCKRFNPKYKSVS